MVVASKELVLSEEVLVRNVQYYITLRTNIWIEAEEPDS